MKLIAIDEAGYTGQDLINKEQPVFTLSSVCLTIEEATELTNLISSNAKELKFNRLRRYSKFVNELEKFLNHELISDKTVKIAIAHKEYMIIAQTVDKLIEPVFLNKGIDIYKEGMNLGLTNMLYYTLPTFCGENLIYDFYNAFVKMFRNKKNDDIKSFYQIIHNLINSSKSNDYKHTLQLIQESHYFIQNILNISDNFFLDASTPSFVRLIDFWGKTLNSKFDVIADTSKPLKHYENLISMITSQKLKDTEIGYGSRTLQLPLKVNDLLFNNSKDYIQIQIADLIAGASAYYGKSLTRHGEKDNLSEMIADSKISKLFFSSIWPHEAVTPEELKMDESGNNALDELTKIFDNAS